MSEIKTITSLATETEITFIDFWQFVWVKNTGNTDCYVSAKSGITAGGADVALIKAGESGLIVTETQSIYSKGATTLECHAQNFAECPFKVQAKGGEPSDLAADMSMTLNAETYVLTAQLKNKNGEAIGKTQSVDLPLENFIADTDYATTSKAGIVKPDGTTITADADGTLHAAAISINSWYDVRTIVRQGLAPTVFQVGDQLTCTKGAETIVWDIVNIASDSITLLMHEPTVEMVYDAKEAIFAFPDGLAAGEYHFYIAQHSWVATDVGKTLNFTLTQAIPEGGQLVLNGAYNATLVGTTISSFSGSTSTTAIETVTMSEGDGGIDLGSINNAGSEANNSNSLQKALLGSNTWKESAQRQWLNSDKAAGSVWTPQTAFDRPPAWVTNTAGFLNGMEPEFVSVVAPTTYVTCRNTVSDDGGSDTLTDKFYLPSRTEIFGTDEVSGISEGTLYQYYANATDADRIKYRSNTAKYWRLRTPIANISGIVRFVYTTGTLSGSGAVIAIGAAAACIIK